MSTEVQILPTTTNEEGECPVCGCTLTEGIVRCERCDTAHHSDCWAYAGGCAIFGCDPDGWKALPFAAEGAQAEVALQHWLQASRSTWFANVAFFLALFATVFVTVMGAIANSASIAGLSLITGGTACFAFLWFLLRVRLAASARGKIESLLGRPLSPPRGSDGLSSAERLVLDGRDESLLCLHTYQNQLLLLFMVLPALLGLKLSLLFPSLLPTALLIVLHYEPRARFRRRQRFIASIARRVQASLLAGKTGCPVASALPPDGRYLEG